MSTASSATALLNDLEMAKKDLAMYAAIIGCKPTVEPAETAPVEPEKPPEPAIAIAPADQDEDHHPYRITVWMRHVSHEAKKRIHEAKMRLAS